MPSPKAATPRTSTASSGNPRKSTSATISAKSITRAPGRSASQRRTTPISPPPKLASAENRRLRNATAGADRELDEREQGRAGEVEVEAHRLVDRKLQRRRPRPAAEGQRHRKAGHAEQEHQHERAGHHRAQHRRLDAAQHVARPEAELGGQPELLGGDRQPALQHQPR